MINTSDYKRKNGRLVDEMRFVSIERNIVSTSLGSVMVSYGNTKVLCTANVEEKSPPWLKNAGKGWITAEYSMLPGSSVGRIQREAIKGKQSGRTQEIQRLIGRSLRASLDLSLISEKTVTIDCDVIQADGGTRTASITGGWLALLDGLFNNMPERRSELLKLIKKISAVSVGLIGENVLLDLDYFEDSSCAVDMNVVMQNSDKFVEIQGTGETKAFDQKELTTLLEFAKKGIKTLSDLQEIFVEQPKILRVVSSDL